MTRDSIIAVVLGISALLVTVVVREWMSSEPTSTPAAPQHNVPGTERRSTAPAAGVPATRGNIGAAATARRDTSATPNPTTAAHGPDQNQPVTNSNPDNTSPGSGDDPERPSEQYMHSRREDGQHAE